jgi:hypothetical protein
MERMEGIPMTRPPRITYSRSHWLVEKPVGDGDWVLDSEFPIHRDAVDRWWKLIHPRTSARSSRPPTP